MRTLNKQIETAVHLNANRTSVSVPLKNILLYSIAAVITGTPTGTIKLQASNDPETNDTTGTPQPSPVNWSDIPDSSFTITTSEEVFWSVSFITYNYVRVIFTDGSSGASTATMNLIFNGKGQ